MARILIVSSWVAAGHVGLSAATPVLQALGHEVIGLPTVMLSNHAGWPRVAGARVPAAQLREMFGALADNGFAEGVDACLTGYLPTAEHAEFGCEVIAAVRRTGRTRVIVDPVLGDLPKGLYIDEAAAVAVRDRLVPLADVVTPNLFELGWLAGVAVGTPETAEAAARAIGPKVLVTSAPAGPGRTGVLEVDTEARLYATPVRQGVPNGVGDVFSALIAAGIPVARAVGQLAALIDGSLGAPHLRIAETAGDWTRAGPVAQGRDGPL